MHFDLEVIIIFFPSYFSVFFFLPLTNFAHPLIFLLLQVLRVIAELYTKVENPDHLSICQVSVFGMVRFDCRLLSFFLSSFAVMIQARDIHWVFLWLIELLAVLHCAGGRC